MMLDPQKVAHDYAIRLEEKINRRLTDREFHDVRRLFLKVFRMGEESHG